MLGHQNAIRKRKVNGRKLLKILQTKSLTKSIIKEEAQIKQIESAIDLEKNGVQQAVSYLKQFFTK
jgi:hypothetical protein